MAVIRLAQIWRVCTTKNSRSSMQHAASVDVDSRVLTCDSACNCPVMWCNGQDVGLATQRVAVRLPAVPLPGARCKSKTGRHNQEIGDRLRRATVSSHKNGRPRRDRFLRSMFGDLIWTG